MYIYTKKFISSTYINKILYKKYNTLIYQMRTKSLCINCKHFIPNVPYNSLLGRCKMFGDVDLITGDISYNTASLCRKYDHFCGKNAKYFSQIIK